MADLRLVLLLLLLGTWGRAQTAPLPPAKEALAAAHNFLRQGNFQKAEAAFQQLVEREPSPEAYAGLVQSFLKRDDVKQAEVRSAGALESFPRSALAHAMRGDVYFRRGLLPEAESEYASAITMDDRCARAWLGKGKVDAILSRDLRAQDAVAKAHDLDPEDGDALYEWAIRQPYPGNVAALAKHLAEFHSDPDFERHERDYLALLRALAGRKVWRLARDVARADLKLALLTLGRNYAPRGYGLRVQFNDRASATLLLDTGASGVTITRRLAEKIGALKLSDQTLEGVGQGGGTSGYQAWADKVMVGDLEFHDCHVHVVPNAVTEIEGVIGADVFAGFLVTLDFPAHSLRLERLEDPGDAARQHDASGTWTQAYSFGHFLLLPGAIGGKATGLLALDSGANTSSVSAEVAKQIQGMRNSVTPVLGMSGAASSTSAADVTLGFGGVRRDVHIISIDLHSVSKSLGVEVSGQIGLNALDRARILINYREGLVRFEYPHK